MSVLVVGSVAYDTVKTSAGERVDALGGSATFFSVSSSYFTPVSLVAVIGEDFRKHDIDLLKSHGVETAGLEKATGKTFRWSGVYGAEDVNTRTTLDTQLNVFANFKPKLNPDHRKHQYLFLANIHPALQLDVLGQMASRPKLVALDTMNFWISGERQALGKVVQKVDVLFMDEGEARSFSGEANLLKAAKRIISMGPHTMIIKRGEHGVLVFRKDSIFAAPAFPLETVVDPTGAGDSFAGGFMGYLAATGDLSANGFRRAAILGSVMGSFAVESFSLDRIHTLTNKDIESRFRGLSSLTQFTPLSAGESLPWRKNGS
ncbi:MAG: sugar kinase [SAR202 cluster bacterium]|nr:sugar kinase [SAR202 cluster bacterium]